MLRSTGPKPDRQSDNPTIRQSDNPTIRQSDNPTIRQSDNPTIRLAHSDSGKEYLRGRRCRRGTPLVQAELTRP